MTPLLIGVTMGDAAGIGPETIVKAFPQVKPGRCRLFVIGDAQEMKQAAERFNPKVEIIPFDDPLDLPESSPSQILVLDRFRISPQGYSYGKPQASTGELAYQSILLGAELASKGLLSTLVTAPICKESLHLAGHPFDGHTGLLAHLTQTTDYRMTFSTKDLRIIHTTAHMAFKDVSPLITKKRVFDTIKIGYQHLQDLGVEQPRIAVCGLNPHASEAGIFGSEDMEQVLPAIQQAQALGWDVVGPEPGDAVFIQAFKGKYDLVVAQYHDQGHIPGKLMAFDSGVNVTVGLPFARCSPDHGTAFDIAGQGVANPINLIEAIDYALLLAR